MTQETRSKLFKIAAGIIRKGMSDFPEDYPKSMPKSALRDINDFNNYLRDCAYELEQIAKGET